MTNYEERLTAAIDFIEDRLLEPISTSSVAEHIGFSEYHFHRIFQGMLGESVAAYIRKRRISEAATLLRTSDRAILDLALMSGFESQEAFTRAFKKVFKLSPGAYRKGTRPLSVHHKVRLKPEMIKHLQEGVTLTPRFEEKGPWLVVGLGGSYSEEKENVNEIGLLWQKFLERKHELVSEQNCSELSFGVCMASHPQIPLETGKTFVYIAGVPIKEVDKLPKGMVSCTIPKAKYAVFTHKGSLEKLPHTLRYIWGTWIPQNIKDYKHVNGPDFEIYDKRFKLDSEESEFDICVPLEIL
ncbi:MAG: AraC family transcriptional regulator [Candidatus Obscuribacterales bacterium]|nr:AraC family transcriptional regulator [Candidatus Obscuribacterales bacterium]